MTNALSFMAGRSVMVVSAVGWGSWVLGEVSSHHDALLVYVSSQLSKTSQGMTITNALMARATAYSALQTQPHGVAVSIDDTTVLASLVRQVLV
jgi:hypothetical protein